MQIKSDNDLDQVDEVLAGLSEKENQRMKKKIGKVGRRGARLSSKLNELIRKVSQQSVDKTEAIEALKEIRADINEAWRDERERLEGFRRRRQQENDTFTVSLFGRTNAGKSTLLEGILGGDGSTIGQGEQRTTENVTAYDWEGIQLLDTPGIAAFDGEEDEAIAWEAIDRSDLILFMVMSDSIQKSEFDQFVDLRNRNKPVLIVLNVKRDIDHGIRRRRFLRKKKQEVTPEGQAGNIEELKHRAREYLGHPSVSVIPIHARAVYLASNAESDDERAKLLEASRIDDLLTQIQDAAVNRGGKYRIRTYRDETIHSLRRLEGEAKDQLDHLRDSVAYHEKKLEELETWFEDFEDRVIDQIRSRVGNLFESKLYGEVDSFVERYAGDKSADRRWKRKMRNLDLQEPLAQITENIGNEAKRKIEEHIRQEDFDESVLDLNLDTRLGDAKRGYLGRIMNALAGIADLVAVVTGGISKFIGSAIRILKWWIGVDDRRDYRRKKSKAKSRIKKRIREKEKEAVGKIIDWFDESIASPFRVSLKGTSQSVLRAQSLAIESMEDFQKAINRLTREENRKLIQALVDVQIGSRKVEKIVRRQGTAVKVKIKSSDVTGAFRRTSATLGEPVDPVESDVEKESQIRQALNSISPADVRSNGKAGSWNVEFSPRSARNISQERIQTHVRLTEQLLDVTLSTDMSPSSSNTDFKTE